LPEGTEMAQVFHK